MDVKDLDSVIRRKFKWMGYLYRGINEVGKELKKQSSGYHVGQGAEKCQLEPEVMEEDLEKIG